MSALSIRTISKCQKYLEDVENWQKRSPVTQVLQVSGQKSPRLDSRFSLIHASDHYVLGIVIFASFSPIRSRTARRWRINSYSYTDQNAHCVQKHFSRSSLADWDTPPKPRVLIGEPRREGNFPVPTMHHSDFVYPDSETSGHFDFLVSTCWKHFISELSTIAINTKVSEYKNLSLIIIYFVFEAKLTSGL